MMNVLRSVSCVLAATVARSFLGSSTFLSVEAAASSWSEVQKEFVNGSVLICALAPISVNIKSKEIHNLHCVAE